MTIPDFPGKIGSGSGTPVQDHQEMELQQRCEDRTGAEAGLQTEQGHRNACGIAQAGAGWMGISGGTGQVKTS